MAPLRSSRRNAPRKKYTVDAFEGIEELVLESASSSGSGSSSEDELNKDASDEDDPDEAEEEFQADAEPAEETDDDAMSGAEEDLAVEEESDNLVSDAGEQDLDDAMSIATDNDLSHPPIRGKGRQRPARLPHGEQIHIRAVRDDTTTKSSSVDRRLYYLGPTAEDYQSVIEAQRRWKYEPCLPSRKPSGPHGGFAHTEAYIQEIKRSSQNWEWYTTYGGREAFRQRQLHKELTSDETQAYLQHDSPSERALLMGPVQERKLYVLQIQQCVALSDPFTGPPKDGKPVKKRPSTYKSGFVINLGARVHCLDWAPNQSGPKQYLAVAVKLKGAATNASSNASQAPAFAAQTASNTSIQIWEFGATQQDYIDKGKPPRLSIVLCAAMGYVKELKWCPVPCKAPNKLGLLGCVSADGFLRVFDLSKPSNNAGTANALIEKAAFESKPPDTICTSLTWLSSSRIAAACANGFVAVWDLSKSLKSTVPNARPETYAGVSITYIASITSGWPSFPNLLMCVSMSGFMTITDITKPKPASPAGTAHSLRRRIPQAQSRLVYNDFAHAAFNAEENLGVRAHPIRRWWGAFNTNKITSHSTSFAVSPCHPFVLAGTASGDVIGHNPLDRIAVGTKSNQYQQKWFSHEWRRPHDLAQKAAEPAAAEDLAARVIGTTGLARITDGFKAEQVTFKNSEMALTCMLFEEKSAVTSLAWNPNLECGGWAAAGMADGLLRVEDIAS